MTDHLGGNSGSRADASSQQAVSTKGFDPGRKKDLHALRESGWIMLRNDNDELEPKFLFGGSIAIATRFHGAGILDSDGFTPLGRQLRDTYGRGRARLADTREEAA